ncbi:MAG: glycosyltransferase family 2 protein [Cyanobacteriota bacterium]|jgi:hypothetical protein
MTFAITYTVKNEQRLVLESLIYYRHLGCSRFYVFLDHTTDNLPNLLSSHSDVLVRPSVSPAELNDHTVWFEQIQKDAEGWLDLRKKLNTYWASLHARDCGVEWIAAIDPDELIIHDLHIGVIRPKSLASFLRKVPQDIGQLRMVNLDNIPVGPRASHPFSGSDLFLNRPKEPVEIFWRYSRSIFRLLIRNPEQWAYYQAWYDQLFFKCLLGDAFPRLVRHPLTGKELPTGYFLSYTSGKSFVRTDLLHAIRPDVHYWFSLPGAELRTVRQGIVLHYDMIDADYFVHKFRQRPKNSDVSTVKSLYKRWVIARVAVDLPDEAANAFFRQSIAIMNPIRQDYLLKKGVLRRIPAVKAFFESQSSS